MTAYQRLKAEVIAFYSHGTNVCACCGESQLSMLTANHIDEDGAKHRREIGRTSGHQFYLWLRQQRYPYGQVDVLCLNCNMAKTNNGGRCPHLSPAPELPGQLALFDWPSR